MPVGFRKNTLYRLALPVFGKYCDWSMAARHGETAHDLTRQITRVFKRNHVIGGCVQLIRDGALVERYFAGNASLSPTKPITDDTVFRTASIAKMACALLVMRLQTLGKLNVNEDISAFWNGSIRNQRYPEVPIPLASLLSHTSGMMDSALYFSSFERPVTVREILADPELFTAQQPFERFRYSNFAAGLIGCLLETRFHESFETLARREVFDPLHACATFDLSTLGGVLVADSYRVLPPSSAPAFNAAARFRCASPLDTPDPQTHFLLASGSLFITAEGLARLALPLLDGGLFDSRAFLNAEALAQMTTPTARWPEPEVRMRHGMGLLELDDPKILSRRLLGHQGFAYGAVNGVFFDENGNGFASLNSGASEMRIGHLSCLNRDLIDVILKGDSV